MNEVLTLQQAREEAIFLLDTIQKAWPEHFNRHDIEETTQAQAELNELASQFEDGFRAYLKDESLTDSEENLYDFIAQTTFAMRQDRLLQSIELYHLLNIAARYTQHDTTSLTQKFTNLSTGHDRVLLHDYILLELQDYEESIAHNPDTLDSKAKAHILRKCRQEMDKTFDTPTSADAQKIDFSIDTVIAQTLGIATQELEFATQIAIKFSADQDDSFKMRKDYLSNFIQHVGKISDALIAPEQENNAPVALQSTDAKTSVPTSSQETAIKTTTSDTFLRAISLPQNRQIFNSKTWRIPGQHERDYTQALLTLFQKIPYFIYGIEDVDFEGYVGEDQKIHLKYSAQKDSPDYNFTAECIKGINEELGFAHDFNIDCQWNEKTETYIIKNADELFRIAIYLHDEFAEISPDAEAVLTSTACSIREMYRPDDCDLEALTREQSQIAILKGLKTIVNKYEGAGLFTITPFERHGAYFFIIGCNDDDQMPQPDNAEDILRAIYDDLQAIESFAPFVSFEMWPCQNNFALGIDDPEEIVPLFERAYSELNIDLQDKKKTLISPDSLRRIAYHENSFMPPKMKLN